MNKFNNLISKKSINKIVCLTAYSKNIATIIDNHADIILVGDSLGSVLYNFKSTKSVTLDMMINHASSVRLGTKKAILVVDMPYNTYRNPKMALKNAKIIMSKTKCDAVKLEGGKRIIPIIKTLIKNKIPVMGHLGILPQTEKKFVFKGKKLNERKKLSKEITNRINIPTIGIGASVYCDGQVLVTDDLLGLSDGNFKFVKKYTDIKKTINSAIKKFKFEVKNKKFPSNKFSFTI